MLDPDVEWAAIGDGLDEARPGCGCFLQRGVMVDLATMKAGEAVYHWQSCPTHMQAWVAAQQSEETRAMLEAFLNRHWPPPLALLSAACRIAEREPVPCR